MLIKLYQSRHRYVWIKICWYIPSIYLDIYIYMDRRISMTRSIYIDQDMWIDICMYISIDTYRSGHQNVSIEISRDISIDIYIYIYKDISRSIYSNICWSIHLYISVSDVLPIFNLWLDILLYVCMYCFVDVPIQGFAVLSSCELTLSCRSHLTGHVTSRIGRASSHLCTY